MSYYTYILQSELTGRHYIGQTNNLEKRLYRHNKGYNLATRNRGPWEIIYSREFETRRDAVRLEKKLKGFKNPDKIDEWIKRQVG